MSSAYSCDTNERSRETGGGHYLKSCEIIQDCRERLGGYTQFLGIITLKQDGGRLSSPRVAGAVLRTRLRVVGVRLRNDHPTARDVAPGDIAPASVSTEWQATARPPCRGDFRAELPGASGE